MSGLLYELSLLFSHEQMNSFIEIRVIVFEVSCFTLVFVHYTVRTHRCTNYTVFFTDSPSFKRNSLFRKTGHVAFGKRILDEGKKHLLRNTSSNAWYYSIIREVYCSYHIRTCMSMTSVFECMLFTLSNFTHIIL